MHVTYETGFSVKILKTGPVGHLDVALVDGPVFWSGEAKFAALSANHPRLDCNMAQALLSELRTAMGKARDGKLGPAVAKVT
ncbi:MAG: hypothetical protein PVSMB1_16960 [Gemmatimonadaceae bacterium]